MNLPPGMHLTNNPIQLPPAPVVSNVFTLGDPSSVPRVGMPVVRNGEIIGTVTSCSGDAITVTYRVPPAPRITLDALPA